MRDAIASNNQVRPQTEPLWKFLGYPSPEAYSAAALKSQKSTLRYIKRRAKKLRLAETPLTKNAPPPTSAPISGEDAVSIVASASWKHLRSFGVVVSGKVVPVARKILGL